MLITSIGTADSVTVLVGLREPITTSFSASPPSVKVIFKVDPETVAFLDSNPIYENCKMAPIFAVIV